VALGGQELAKPAQAGVRAERVRAGAHRDHRCARLRRLDGVAYAAHGNPFECLLRIAYSGIVVEKVTPQRVVLVVVED
jgi:hypothetical protein